MSYSKTSPVVYMSHFKNSAGNRSSHAQTIASAHLALVNYTNILDQTEHIMQNN